MLRRTHLGALALALAGPDLRAESGAFKPPVLRVGVVSRDPEGWAATQLLEKVYALAGLQPQFVPMLAARSGLSVISGDVDADIMRVAGFGVQHPHLLRVPTPFYRLEVVVASLPTRHARVLGREDLQHYSLGAVRGYLYVQELTEGHPAVTLTLSSEHLCRMLMAGRVELALDTQTTLLYTLQRLGMRDVLVSPPLLTLELFHYLHPRHAAWVRPIDEALRALGAKGELARLARQFEARALTMRPEQFDWPASAP